MRRARWLDASQRRDDSYRPIERIDLVILGDVDSVGTGMGGAGIGTMKALGYKNRDVFRLVILECFVIGAIGAAVGLVSGIGLAMLISYIGIAMPPPPNSSGTAMFASRSVLTQIPVGGQRRSAAGARPARHRRRRLD